jgi:pilus assembly protein CpaC
MTDKRSANKVWALGLMFIGATALLPAQTPVQAVSVERQILLRVKFAALDQEKEHQFGVNLLDGPGSTTRTGSGGTLSVTQALNLLTLDPKLNVGAFVMALQNESILKVLAEPNLVTTNGKEANFLVGGELPVAILIGGATSGAISVQSRKYGVNLTFTPIITPNSNIAIHLKREVIAFDQANAVVLNGFTIPALSARTAESTVELGDGQSFVVAGLINDQEQDALSRAPFISSIPILGGLFKSENDKVQHSDLIMIVTPSSPPGVIGF